MIGCLAMAFIYFTTRGEAICLAKMERQRGSVRSAQIITCDVKKCDTPDSPILSFSREVMVPWSLSGFLPSLRESFRHHDVSRSFEYVLLL
jgi:hypothetical protein